MKLYEHQSPLQHILLALHPTDGLVLELDGMQQFAESIEYRYHEGLALVPLLFSNPAKVFIAGGGDGLAVTRLLRFECVQRIVLCEHDAAVLELARTQEDLVALNENALADKRVEVLAADAVATLQATSERFDLILCDFPDPYTSVLDSLYTTAFYSMARQRLEPGGILVVQTAPIAGLVRVVRATMAAAFPQTAYYHPFPNHSFTMGSDAPFERVRLVPPWARFLTEALTTTLFALPRDTEQQFAPKADDVNHPGARRAVKATLASTHGESITKIYPFRKDHWVFLMLDEEEESLDVEDVELLLEAADESSPLVVLATAEQARRHRAVLERLGYRESSPFVSAHFMELDDEAHDQRMDRWNELDDGSVATLHARTCRASEDQEVLDMLGAYLAKGRPREFVVPESRFDLDERARYLTTRDRRGKGVALCKVVDIPTDGDACVELELLFCLGNEQQAALSLCLIFNYLEREGVSNVEMLAAAPDLGREVVELGGDKLAPMRALLRSDRPTS